MILTLDDAPFAGRTGRGVRVAVVDSGIASGHPHVGDVVEAVAVGPASPTSGMVTPEAAPPDVMDRIGHGTAVAAAIREKAPEMELISVKVFHRSLATTAELLAEGISRSVALGARLINLSLGTANAAHADLLRAAVAAAAREGAIVVSAFESQGVRWLPGALPFASPGTLLAASQGASPGVAAVIAGWDGPRDAIALREGEDGRIILVASAYPRPIPGVPKERNLSGVSFAVANATGFLARLLEGAPELRGPADLEARWRALIAGDMLLP